MEEQLGGLIDAGFVILGFYEDRRSDDDGNPIRFFMPSVFVARAVSSQNVGVWGGAGRSLRITKRHSPAPRRTRPTKY